MTEAQRKAEFFVQHGYKLAFSTKELAEAWQCETRRIYWLVDAGLLKCLGKKRRGSKMMFPIEFIFEFDEDYHGVDLSNKEKIYMQRDIEQGIKKMRSRRTSE